MSDVFTALIFVTSSVHANHTINFDLSIIASWQIMGNGSLKCLKPPTKDDDKHSMTHRVVLYINKVSTLCTQEVSSE